MKPTAPFPLQVEGACYGTLPWLISFSLGSQACHEAGNALMNESLKQKVERAIGDEFVEWFNRATGSEFHFDHIGADPPDLVHSDSDKTMPVEVATSYYHEEDSIMRWKHTRNPNQSMKPTAPRRCNLSDLATTPCRGLSLSR